MNEFEVLGALYQRDQGIGVPYPETEGGGMTPNHHITKLRKYFDDNKIHYEVRFWEEDRYNIHVVLEYKTISFVTSTGSYGGLEGLIEFYNFRDEPTGHLTVDEAIVIYEKEVAE